MSTCPLPSTHMVKNLYSSSTRAGDQGEARRLPSSQPQHDRMTLFYSSAVASDVPVSAVWWQYLLIVIVISSHVQPGFCSGHWVQCCYAGRDNRASRIDFAAESQQQQQPAQRRGRTGRRRCVQLQAWPLLVLECGGATQNCQYFTAERGEASWAACDTLALHRGRLFISLSFGPRL